MDAPDEHIVSLYAVLLVVTITIRFCHADADVVQPGMHEFLVHLLFVEPDSIGIELYGLEARKADCVFYFFHKSRVHERVANGGGEADGVPPHLGILIGCLFESFKGHDPFGSDTILVSTKNAFGTADTRDREAKDPHHHLFLILFVVSGVEEGWLLPSVVEDYFRVSEVLAHPELCIE